MLQTRAPAKINVCLRLGPTRESDGRHELVTVFQPLELADEVTLEPSPSGSDEVVCAGVEGPNLVSAAVAAFRETFSYDGDAVHITVDKQIPVAGGMAGSSADAAAALRLLHEHTGLGDEAMLELIATGLGADVPAQVHPRRTLGTGAGERLEPLPVVEPYAVLVVTSEHGLATGAVFAEADRLGLPQTDLDAVARSIRERPDLRTEDVVNDLQPAALSLRPDLEATLAAVTRHGADVALLSGSGPTVLGLFADDDAAHAAATALPRARLTRTLS